MPTLGLHPMIECFRGQNVLHSSLVMLTPEFQPKCGLGGSEMHWSQLVLGILLASC